MLGHIVSFLCDYRYDLEKAKRFEKGKSEGEKFLNSDNVLTITFDHSISTDVSKLEICFLNEESRDTWFNILNHAKHQNDRKILSKTIRAEKNYVLNVFNEAMKNRKTTNGRMSILDVNEFHKSYENILQTPDVLNIFDEITKTYKGIAITPDELTNFLRKEQRHSLSFKECEDIIKVYTDCDNQYDNIGPKDFLRLFKSSTYFDVQNDTKSKMINQDMTYSLSRYWINTSHHTYLAGNQITSDSAITQYIKALLSGCRCVEVREAFKRQTFPSQFYILVG